MGYTHYTYRPVNNAGSAYFYGELALDAKKLCEYANANGIRIRNGLGEGEPEFTEFHFSINGDASHSVEGKKFAFRDAIIRFAAVDIATPISFAICR